MSKRAKRMIWTGSTAIYFGHLNGDFSFPETEVSLKKGDEVFVRQDDIHVWVSPDGGKYQCPFYLSGTILDDLSPIPKKEKKIQIKKPGKISKDSITIPRKEYLELQSYKEAYKFFNDEAEVLDDESPGTGYQTLIYTGRSRRETKEFWRRFNKKYNVINTKEEN
jgi:hypothetical protein